jgi:hypothetical protein
MEILNTREELEALFADSTEAFGYINIDRKSSASTLHAGHEALITYSKTLHGKTVVSFWNGIELIYHIFGGDYFLNDIGNAWDSTGCLAWCEAQGVDYVLLPDDWYSTQYLTDLGILDSTGLEVYELVDGIWNTNGYADHEPTPTDASLYNTTLRAKTFVILQNYKTQLNCHFISSWKDGEPRFTVSDYINNHSTELYHLIDPIKTPDNLYYSTAYFGYTQDQKDLLLQIETTVDSVGYSDTTALTVALEALNTGTENFSVIRIDVNIGGVVGAANDFISIKYLMDGVTDSYPIYKKGVR